MPTPHRTSILLISARADWGGGPEHLFQLVQRLPQGIDPLIACPEDYPYFERYAKLAGRDNLFSIPHRAFSVGRFCRLVAWTRRRKVRLIHSHGRGAGVYGRLLSIITGIPCVHTSHGVHGKTMSGVKKHLYLLFERCVGLFTSRLIAVSAGEQSELMQSKFAPADRLVMIPNGVNMPENPVHAPQENPYMIVHITRFDEAKHSDFIPQILLALRAEGVLEQFHVHFVGEGKGRAEVEALCAQQCVEGQVTFHGALPAPERFFAGALCLLSTSRHEGMPLAVLEAMAHGLTPVLSNVVGNCDAVTDMLNGLLYPLDDAAACCACLLRLKNEPELRSRLAAQARQTAIEKYDIGRSAAATVALYREVLHTGSF